MKATAPELRTALLNLVRAGDEAEKAMPTTSRQRAFKEALEAARALLEGKREEDRADEWGLCPCGRLHRRDMIPCADAPAAVTEEHRGAL